MTGPAERERGMAKAGTPTLIERKIAAARPLADAGAMTADRALGLALARTAESMLQLPLTPIRATLQAQTGAEIVETLPDTALLAILEGPRETLGLAALDAGTLAALIEMMTLGQLSAANPATRRPTRTDAAIVAGFVDGTLGQLEALLAAEPDVTWAGGFRYASHLADPRPLGLMLDEPCYRVFRLTLGFGAPTGPTGAARQGSLVLALPAKGRGSVPVQPAAETDDATAAAGAARARDERWEVALEGAVLGAQAEIRAVLGRVILPLADLLRLETGVSLPLPMAALQMVQVEAEDDSLLCRAQLGQGNGRRALRLYLPEDAGDEVFGQPATATELVPAAAQPMQRTQERRPGAEPAERAALAARPALTPEPAATEAPADAPVMRRAQAG